MLEPVAHSTTAFGEAILRLRKETGLSQEPETLVLELLRKIRADVARVDEKVDAAKADLHSDMLRSARTSPRTSSP